MQQIFKTSTSLRWMIPVLVAAISFAGCNNSDTKTTTSAVDSSSSKMTTADSGSSKMATVADTLKPAKDTLPPLDTTVTHRPENRAIKKP